MSREERFQKLKAVRHEDWEYLNKNVEIRAILHEFIQELSRDRPKDFKTFTQNFWGRDVNELKEKIDEHVKFFKRSKRTDIDEDKFSATSASEVEDMFNQFSNL